MNKEQGKRMFLFVCLLALAIIIDYIFRNIRSTGFVLFVAVSMASILCFIYLDEAYASCLRKERKLGAFMMVVGVLVFMYTGWSSWISLETLVKANGLPLTFFGLMMYVSSFRFKWS